MKKAHFDNKLSGPAIAAQPLYKQVEDYVTQLIVEQRWKPGEMIPNEFQLAEELGVSQGTVRKGLNALTSAKILTRRQGVGTFVSERIGQPALYRHFPLVMDNGRPELPTAELLKIDKQVASHEVSDSLGLKPDSEVVFMRRRRTLGGEFCIIEDIYLPYARFGKMLEDPEVPHTLYHYYQTQFNQTIHKTVDKIKAISLSAEDAKLLELDEGMPVIQFTRIATGLDGKQIEYRRSRCRSDHYHYLVDAN